MNQHDEVLERALAWKRGGGVPLTVFVSSSVWLGGVLGESVHEPFVAIAPANWEDEEEATFFGSAEELDAFIEVLKAASLAAFSDDAQS